MLNLHVKIAKFGWGGMPPDPATTVWFVTFFNPYEFAGMFIEQYSSNEPLAL